MPGNYFLKPEWQRTTGKTQSLDLCESIRAHPIIETSSYLGQSVSPGAAQYVRRLRTWERDEEVKLADGRKLLQSQLEVSTVFGIYRYRMGNEVEILYEHMIDIS